MLEGKSCSRIFPHSMHKGKQAQIQRDGFPECLARNTGICQFLECVRKVRQSIKFSLLGMLWSLKVNGLGNLSTVPEKSPWNGKTQEYFCTKQLKITSWTCVIFLKLFTVNAQHNYFETNFLWCLKRKNPKEKIAKKTEQPSCWYVTEHCGSEHQLHSYALL